MSVMVREEDRDKLGFIWDVNGMPVSYRFAALPFGLRSSSFLFSKQAAAVMYMAKQRGASEDSLFYLDDSITIASSEADCKRSLETLIDTAEKSGFKIQHSKTAGPSRIIEYLGITIDTVQKRLKVSKEKMAEIRQELQEWLNKNECTKRELLSIQRKLFHGKSSQ